MKDMHSVQYMSLIYNAVAAVHPEQMRYVLSLKL